MQIGSVKLASHLHTCGVLWLQLWTNPAAAVLIYVWALSEVQHDPSGFIMSACLNAKPPVIAVPKNHGVANLRLQNMPWCAYVTGLCCLQQTSDLQSCSDSSALSLSKLAT